MSSGAQDVRRELVPAVVAVVLSYLTIDDLPEAGWSLHVAANIFVLLVLYGTVSLSLWLGQGLRARVGTAPVDARAWW